MVCIDLTMSQTFLTHRGWFDKNAFCVVGAVLDANGNTKYMVCGADWVDGFECKLIGWIDGFEW